MILEMRGIAEARREGIKFISWKFHRKVEVVLGINSSYPSRHNYVYRSIQWCLQLTCKLHLNDILLKIVYLQITGALSLLILKFCFYLLLFKLNVFILCHLPSFFFATIQYITKYFTLRSIKIQNFCFQEINFTALNKMPEVTATAKQTRGR